MISAAKSARDLTANDITDALARAEGLEREILQNALYAGTSSYQWLLATHIYNKLAAQGNVV